MPPPDAATAHYLAQHRQSQAALILARRQWLLMEADIESSWARIAEQLALIVASAQLGAARAGAAYVPAALAEIGHEVAALGEVQPLALAGVASDGRPLGSLLYSSVTHTKAELFRGASLVDSLAAGGKILDRAVVTQVADAGRDGAGIAIAARPKVGYTRLVGATCCQRCAVLAGKFFRWNQGFLRHPRCHCRHVPCEQKDFGGLTDNPSPDQVHDLTIAQRKAISDGADMNQVINAHRKGARSADGMTTTEGATRIAGPRLTPEAIYRLSATHAEAIERLKRFGYLL